MAKIRELLAARQVQYDKADIVIDTSDLSVREVVLAILDKLREAGITL